MSQLSTTATRFREMPSGSDRPSAPCDRVDKLWLVSGCRRWGRAGPCGRAVGQACCCSLTPARPPEGRSGHLGDRSLLRATGGRGTTRVKGGCCYEIYQKQRQRETTRKKYKLKTQEPPCSQFQTDCARLRRELELHAVPRPSWKSLGRWGGVLNRCVPIRARQLAVTFYCGPGLGPRERLTSPG